MKKLIIFQLINLTIALSSYAQKKAVSKLGDNAITKARSREITHRFYTYILNNPPTLSDYYTMFGNRAKEAERNLFFSTCDSLKQKNNCRSRYIERLSNPSKFKSLVFEKIKEITGLTGGYSALDELMNKGINIECYSEGCEDFEMDFSLFNKIYFSIIEGDDGKVRIGDIYLSDGSSIFNIVSGIKKQYYKTIGVINDPDGFCNIREGTGIGFPIKWKFYRNDFFIVYPNFQEHWWKVKNIKTCETGFISRNKVDIYGYSLTKQKSDSLGHVINEVYQSYPCGNYFSPEWP